MKRRHLLAAELFAYGYPRYRERLDDDHVRFTRLMPREVDVLERAEREEWDDARVARALEMEVAAVPDWRWAFTRARQVVDAPNPAETFRRAVRQCIENALEEGRAAGDDDAIDRLVVQVCYRAADMAYLLDERGQALSAYSQDLRREPDTAGQRVEPAGEIE